jgi:17beta-estradiol 17-dehydrogenase / very-long-chain 3-oxoacyl-CoA reductase
MEFLDKVGKFVDRVDDFNVIRIVGLAVVISYILVAIKGIYARCLRPGKNITKTFGKYAIVTGATDGIGKAMAFELAKKGCNVILISRTLDKLVDCQKEIKAKHPQSEGMLSIDFSTTC